MTLGEPAYMSTPARWGEQGPEQQAGVRERGRCGRRRAKSGKIQKLLQELKPHHSEFYRGAVTNGESKSQRQRSWRRKMMLGGWLTAAMRTKGLPAFAIDILRNSADDVLNPQGEVHLAWDALGHSALCVGMMELDRHRCGATPGVERRNWTRVMPYSGSLLKSFKLAIASMFRVDPCFPTAPAQSS